MLVVSVVVDLLFGDRWFGIVGFEFVGCVSRLCYFG